MMQFADLRFPDDTPVKTVGDLERLVTYMVQHREQSDKMYTKVESGDAAIFSIPLPDGKELGDATLKDLRQAIRFEEQCLFVNQQLEQALKKAENAVITKQLRQVETRDQILVRIALDASPIPPTRKPTREKRAWDTLAQRMPVTLLDAGHQTPQEGERTNDTAEWR